MSLKWGHQVCTCPVVRVTVTDLGWEQTYAGAKCPRMDSKGPQQVCAVAAVPGPPGRKCRPGSIAAEQSVSSWQSMLSLRRDVTLFQPATLRGPHLLLASVSTAWGRCQADSTLAHLCCETGDMLQCSASESEVEASASSSCHREGLLPCLRPKSRLLRCFSFESAALGLFCCSMAVAAGACTPGCSLGSISGCCWAPCCCSSCCRADSGDCMSLPSTTRTGFECRVRSSIVRCVLPSGASSNPPSCLDSLRDRLLPASDTFHGSRDLPR